MKYILSIKISFSYLKLQRKPQSKLGLFFLLILLEGGGVTTLEKKLSHLWYLGGGS